MKMIPLYKSARFISFKLGGVLNEKGFQIRGLIVGVHSSASFLSGIESSLG